MRKVPEYSNGSLTKERFSCETFAISAEAPSQIDCCIAVIALQ